MNVVVPTEPTGTLRIRVEGGISWLKLKDFPVAKTAFVSGLV